MVIWKAEISRGILNFVRPAFNFMRSVATGTFMDIIEAKKRTGYNVNVVKRYYRTLTRFADKLEELEAGPLIREVREVRDLLCVMIDEEPYWTPRWHNMLLEIAKEEELLEPTPEPD